MKMSNCIALGVGEGRLEEAATFYETQMGMTRAQAKDNWIEMQSGPLRLFLVADNHGTPTFDIAVADVSEAMDRLLSVGCEETLLDSSLNERFVKTPFGHYFCVSPEGS